MMPLCVYSGMPFFKGKHEWLCILTTRFLVVWIIFTIGYSNCSLVKKFPTFVEPLFTRTLHWSLVRTRWIQYTISHHISVRYFSISSFHWYSGNSIALGVENWEWLWACLRSNCVKLVAEI
jgi:hypothetical protein